jgi:hypothetical protein
MSRFACTALPLLPRRTILAALGAVALAPFAAQAADSPRITDLVDSAGSATDRARALAGRDVTLRGYLDLAPGARDLILTEMPSGPCGLCGVSHDAGATLLINVDGPVPALAAQQMVVVSGRLEIAGDGTVRLVRAAVAT